MGRASQVKCSIPPSDQMSFFRFCQDGMTCGLRTRRRAGGTALVQCLWTVIMQRKLGDVRLEAWNMQGHHNSYISIFGPQVVEMVWLRDILYKFVPAVLRLVPCRSILVSATRQVIKTDNSTLNKIKQIIPIITRLPRYLRGLREVLCCLAVGKWL